jgi:hypothetical protein
VPRVWEGERKRWGSGWGRRIFPKPGPATVYISSQLGRMIRPLADRTIRPSTEEDPFKRWVYLDLECFEGGEWLRIEVVTGERYSLPKFARIKLKGPNLEKFPPNKKIQRKSK